MTDWRRSEGSDREKRRCGLCLICVDSKRCPRSSACNLCVFRGSFALQWNGPDRYNRDRNIWSGDDHNLRIYEHPNINRPSVNILNDDYCWYIMKLYKRCRVESIKPWVHTGTVAIGTLQRDNRQKWGNKSIHSQHNTSKHIRTTKFTARMTLFDSDTLRTEIVRGTTESIQFTIVEKEIPKNNNYKPFQSAICVSQKKGNLSLVTSPPSK